MGNVLLFQVLQWQHDIAGVRGHGIGEFPTIDDWRDHLTTIFPEVRLKTFLEMRGADGGPWRLICALPAYWVGLLYDDTALNEAADLVADWTQDERDYLWTEVCVFSLCLVELHCLSVLCGE